MKKIRFSFFAVLVIAALSFKCSNTFGQNLKFVIDTTKLDAYIQKGISDYSVAGLAIGIVSDTSIIFQKGYGVLNKTKSKTTNPQSLFPIGSCTKAFTCACLGMLVDEHKIAWDDKVTKYLLDFKMHDPYITSELTIRDILSHKSGLGNSNGDALLFGTHFTRDELIEKIQYLPIKDGFRECYGYNNLMYIVAGKIIEKVSNETWEEFIKKRLLKVIGMHNTTTDLTISLETDNLAFPHNEKGELSNYWNVFDPNVGPAGSIISNIEDMNKWLQLLLNNGSLNHQQVIAKNTVEELFSPQTIMQVNPFWKYNGVHFQTYGLGWKLYDYEGKLIAEHTGGGAGFICNMFLIPEKKIGVVILTNQITWLASVLQYYIVDMILEKPERDWSNEMLGYYKEEMKDEKQKKEELLKKRTIGTHPSLAVVRYSGIYKDEIYGEAEVSMENDSLYFRLSPAQGFYDCNLEHWEHDTFKAEFPLSKELDFPIGFLTFDINAQGNVEGFKIKLLNDDTFDNYYFKKENKN
jgi:CubicO group peptidase (beta-lactamase class C family)